MTSWDEVVAKDWVGCDLEVQEGGMRYRGQIKSVALTPDSLQVVMRWCASLRHDGWHFDPPSADLAHGYFSFPTMLSGIGDIGQGRVMVSLPIGLAVFFPREVSRLDPAKVKGLPSEFAEPGFVDPKD